MAESSVGLQESSSLSDYSEEERLLIEQYTEGAYQMLRSLIPGQLTPEQELGLREGAKMQATEKRVAEKKYKYDRLMVNCLSRAAMEDSLDTALKAEARHPSKKTLAFVDMNNLKQINDQLGHDLGDDALRLFNNALAKLRPGDVAGRWGGDEAVILVDGDVKAAAVAAERVRQELKLADSSRERPLGISCSIGLVPFQTGMTVNQIVAEADKTMYVAKQQLQKDAIAISGLNEPELIEDTHSFLESRGIRAPIVAVPPTDSPAFQNAQLKK